MTMIPCEKCNKSFTQHYYFTHIKTAKHLGKTIYKKYHCEKCNKDLKNKTHYLQHLISKQHLGDEYVKKPKKVYHCDKCDIDLRNKSHHQSHMKSKKHLGDEFVRKKKN